MSDCVFCDIVTGTAPAQILYSDDEVVAFLDIRPIMRGHSLVIPRQHGANVADLPAHTLDAVYAVARRIGAAARASALAADGVNFGVNDGRAAFQTVFHHHMHVLPRYRADKFRFARGLLVRVDRDPAATAAQIRSALSR